MDAIRVLKELEFDERNATPEEQEILSQYVGWGGLAAAFDENKASWAEEFRELYTALSPEEYAAARASTLNAHYTSPTVIRAIYDAVGQMGFETGNILEPAMGIGNFSVCSLTPCETAISMEWSWTPSVGVSLRNSILTLKSRWRALKLRIAGIFMIWQSATFRSATIRFRISPMISWGSLFITIFRKNARSGSSGRCGCICDQPFYDGLKKF